MREKERLIKEQERLLEETKFNLEEEIEILKENLGKNEQLKRMVEILVETIVPYMENTTEDGAFESPMFDIEQGIVEKSFPDERLEDEGKDDSVMTFNNNAVNGLWNANSGVEDYTRDLPKLKRSSKNWQDYTET